MVLGTIVSPHGSQPFCRAKTLDYHVYGVVLLEMSSPNVVPRSSPNQLHVLYQECRCH